jgi:hypothetical protein
MQKCMWMCECAYTHIYPLDISKTDTLKGVHTQILVYKEIDTEKKIVMNLNTSCVAIGTMYLSILISHLPFLKTWYQASTKQRCMYFYYIYKHYLCCSRLCERTGTCTNDLYLGVWRVNVAFKILLKKAIRSLCKNFNMQYVLKMVNNWNSETCFKWSCLGINSINGYLFSKHAHACSAYASETNKFLLLKTSAYVNFL